jgi:holin-like protein
MDLWYNHIVKYLYQFLLLMAFVLAGELVYAAVPLPIPASIWGLLLLFGALASGIVKLAQIEKVANFFLIIIPVLFVVPAVGIIEVFGGIAKIWPIMLLIILITYLAAMASTGWLADWMIEIKNKRAKK